MTVLFSQSDRSASKKSNQSSELGIIEKYLMTQYLLLTHFNAPIYDYYKIQTFITLLLKYPHQREKRFKMSIITKTGLTKFLSLFLN